MAASTEFDVTLEEARAACEDAERAAPPRAKTASKKARIARGSITLPDGRRTELAVYEDGTDAPGSAPDEAVLAAAQSRQTFHVYGLPHPDDAPERYAAPATPDEMPTERIAA